METQELLKLISLLLQYPDEEIHNLNLKQFIENIETHELYENFSKFDKYLKENSLYELQENYVQTFDFNEKVNLYLTFSKSGDEKQRGQMLAELKCMYEYAGFELKSSELPDFLPLILEFVSHSDKEIMNNLLLRFRDKIVQMQETLDAQKNPYAYLLQALVIIINSITLKEVLS